MCKHWEVPGPHVVSHWCDPEWAAFNRAVVQEWRTHDTLDECYDIGLPDWLPEMSEAEQKDSLQKVVMEVCGLP